MKTRKATSVERARVHKKLQNFNNEFIDSFANLSFSAFEGRKWVGGIVARRDMQSVAIDFLYVEPAFRKLGFGTQLLERVEKEALKQNATHILLSAFDFQNPNFYIKHGFQELARVPSDSGRAGIRVMLKNLM